MTYLLAPSAKNFRVQPSRDAYQASRDILLNNWCCVVLIMSWRRGHTINYAVLIASAQRVRGQ